MAAASFPACGPATWPPTAYDGGGASAPLLVEATSSILGYFGTGGIAGLSIDATGGDLLCAVLRSNAVPVAPPAVSFDGIAMTRLAGSAVTDGQGITALWVLPDPPAGAHDIVVTAADAMEQSAMAAFVLRGGAASITAFGKAGAYGSVLTNGLAGSGETSLLLGVFSQTFGTPAAPAIAGWSGETDALNGVFLIAGLSHAGGGTVAFDATAPTSGNLQSLVFAVPPA